MFAIASKILLCLLLAAILGFIIGYLFARMRKCDNKEEQDENVVKYYPKQESLNVADDSDNTNSDAQTPVSKQSALGAKPIVVTKESVTPDDLKKIKGVGTKIEEALNELGVYTFEQIATWNEKNVAWVDEHLVFKGRIQREEWIKQAKILASGEDTEFSKNYKKS